MKVVDLNSDLGESFGAYKIGRDSDVLPLVTSANIACGFHAGDPSVMKKRWNWPLKAVWLWVLILAIRTW